MVWWVWENPTVYTEEVVNGVPYPGRKVLPWKEGKSWPVLKGQPGLRRPSTRFCGFCMYSFGTSFFQESWRKESGVMYCHGTNSSVTVFLNFSYYTFPSLSGGQKRVLCGLAVRSAQDFALIAAQLVDFLYPLCWFFATEVLPDLLSWSLSTFDPKNVFFSDQRLTVVRKRRQNSNLSNINHWYLC